MANDTVLNAGSGGDTIKTVDLSTHKIVTGGINLVSESGPTDEGSVCAANPLPSCIVDASAPSRKMVVNASGQASVILAAASLVGQTTMSASIPVTLASNQSALAVSQSGTWNVGTVTTVTTCSTVTAVTTVGTITNVVHVDDNSGSLTVDGSVNAIDSTSALSNAGTSLTPKFAKISSSSTTGGVELVAAVSLKKIRVLRWRVTASVANNVYFKSHTAGQISETSYLPDTGVGGGAYCKLGHFETTAGEALDVVASVASAWSASITYVEV